MKLKSGFIALAMSALAIMSCNNQQTPEEGYIGPSDITIADGHMTPEVLLSFGRLSDPQISPDGTKILYGVSYTSIADNRSCRNIFVCNPDGSGKAQLTWNGKSVSNARWSADGKTIYFLYDGKIWSAPFLGDKLGKRTLVGEVPGGISEFSLSPDNSSVLYVSTVHGPITQPADTDPALDKAQAYVTEDLMYRHWDHWVTEIPQTYIAPLSQIDADHSVNLLGDGAGKYLLPNEPHLGLEQLSWSPDGKYVAYSCKKLEGKQYAFSTNTEIYIYEVATGKTTVIPMGGGYDTDPRWSPDGKKIAWLSMRRDGYEADQSRLMVADIAGGEASNITFATPLLDRNVSDPQWSADSKYVYFNALTDGIGAIYRVATTPAAQPERLTGKDLWYDFGTPFAVLDDGTMLTSYASMDFPTELVAVKDGAVKPITKENEHILSQLADHKTEMRTVKTVDGKDMLTWVLYPPQFDSTKVYPAIEIFLGGPQGTLSQEWSYRWNYRLMAAQGYIVVLPNRRGTTAFGQDWCEEISGDYIGLNMQDYLSAGRMIKSEPYVGKLAGCGASYGGYSVYYMAGIHDGLYDCFVSHAGIFDEKGLYYTTEEMWFPNWDNGGLQEYSYTPGEMGPRGDGVTFGGIQQAGSPWSNIAKAQRHYSNSPAANITKWNTPILCIHGCMDFRIPYTQGMAAFNAAQMMGVPSKLVIFPEETHWVLQPQNALFWHREYFDWLDKWCKDTK